MSIGGKMDVNLIISVLYEAVSRRNISIALYLGQDSQYSSQEFQNKLALYGVNSSMSFSDDYNNYYMKSFKRAILFKIYLYNLGF